jgi:DNA-binding NarL/FixJ family response regulator
MQVSGQEVRSSANVFVMADNRLLRQTLVRLFRKRSDLYIVGDSCCSDSMTAEIVCVKSDLLLLDCVQPDRKTDSLIADLRQALPEIKIILFGMDDDPERFLQAVRLGINGCVLKDASAAELLDAVRLVAQGEATCPPKFCKVLFDAIAAQSNQTATNVNPHATTRFDLTQRQRQLMSLVERGLSNKEIAANLNLSEFTVKNHIYRVMKQVDAQDRREAASLIRADANREDGWRRMNADSSD